MPIAVVTDSTADIPPEVARRHNIHVVPLNLYFGTEEFKDGVTIQADEFYRRLTESKELPTTSQPAPGEFTALYEKLGETHDGIISLHLSGKLSKTVNSAAQGKEAVQADNCRIEVIDTQQATASLGLTVLGVSQAVAQGADMEEALSLAADLAARARFDAMLQTLEYLAKGGRVGRAQAFLGGLLKFTPIITFENGEAQPVERPRTRRRGIERLKALVTGLAPFDQLAVLHANEPDEAQTLIEELQPFKPAGGEIVAGRVGPVVGTYGGPGAIGIGFI
ncbi:MAG: DegV family protein, partial [Chloroflexota bacterium]